MTIDLDEKKGTAKQCRSCPWRVDCVPERDIPRYDRELHKSLRGLIVSELASLRPGRMRVMACHYSEPGEEFACAGWLHYSIGPGNNIGVRLSVMRGAMPMPEVDGPQHETFEETLGIPEVRR